jgi:hypothetical protein
VLPAFLVQGMPGMEPVLATEVSLKRTFYLLIHADNQSLARIRATTQFIYAEVQSNRALFDPFGRF